MSVKLLTQYRVKGIMDFFFVSYLEESVCPTISSTETTPLIKLS